MVRGDILLSDDDILLTEFASLLLNFEVKLSNLISFIEFDELYTVYMIFSIFIFIIYSVIGECLWFTHSFNARNGFFFKKNFKKQLYLCISKVNLNSIDYIYYSFLYLTFFY
jgi:hypothetical protein